MIDSRDMPIPLLNTALGALKEKRTDRDKENVARFGIYPLGAYPTPKVIGVSMANIQEVAKRFGRNHSLAADLWSCGWYEARLLACFVEEPERVSADQMDRWARDFDNWAICDTACFKLFDQTRHAWAKIDPWRRSRKEFVKRAAFALLASLAGHDKTSLDSRFLETLPWVEAAASDERNFVKKGVSWALRRIGTRSPELRAAALATAEKLAASAEPSARWIGQDAIRDLTKPRRKRSEC